MKKIFLITVAAAAMAASCTDLDVPVESVYTEYPSSQIAQDAKLADVYYHLRGTLGRRYMEAQALSSDEWVGVSFGGDYYDDGTYAHACLHSYTPDDASIGWFEDVTSGITKANKAIQEMGATSTGTAGARAIRAYYHWILMDSYGDAPILKEVPSDTTVVLRQSRAKVAKFIAEELEAVIPHLTTEVSANTYGKPTRWMAEALLAKVLINWPVYTADSVAAYNANAYSNDSLDRVVELCDDIMQNGPFNLNDSYLSKFYPNNGSQITDFIYAIPYTGANKDGMQYGRPRTWRKGNTDVSYYGTTLSKSVGGNFSITPEMSDRLMKLSNDDRQGHVLAGKIYMYDPITYAKKTDTPWTYKGSEVTLSKTITLAEENEKLDVGNDINGWSQGYKSVKWFIVDEDFKNDRNQSNDVPIFRLADIILLKAEAEARGAKVTNSETPSVLIQRIRSYVHADNYVASSSILDDIYDERAREFFDENWRRNDMIRFGHFEDDYGFHKRSFKWANFEKSHRVFPIPTDVLSKNPKWHQNPGY